MAATNLPVRRWSTNSPLCLDEDAAVTDRLRQLIALTGRWDRLAGSHPAGHPAVRGSAVTNAPEEPSLGSELRAELASADRVDSAGAFISGTGCG